MRPGVLRLWLAVICLVLAIMPAGAQKTPKYGGTLTYMIPADELSPNVGDGLRVQAAAVWDCEDAGLAASSIPSVNLTP